jgi:hypothetical protein
MYNEYEYNGTPDINICDVVFVIDVVNNVSVGAVGGCVLITNINGVERLLDVP